ncbi:ATP-binding protein [Candidatus Saccharibacteria bacterium]|jgi:Predicted ATPase|nr:ATP-binding protein [Candidatus Saccharibacteria bacterium]
MNQTNWYVITGGPGTGKTRLITMLADLGYGTVPEAARTIIDEGLARGETLEQIRGDETAWQHKILRRILDTETALDPKALLFFDRGAHDGLAFLKLKGIMPDSYWQELIDHPRKPYYKMVFLLEPLPAFEHDYARTENAEITRQLTELTAEVYAEFGMEPIRIPYLPPEERLKLILSHVSPKQALASV